MQREKLMKPQETFKKKIFTNKELSFLCLLNHSKVFIENKLHVKVSMKHLRKRPKKDHAQLGRAQKFL